MAARAVSRVSLMTIPPVVSKPRHSGRTAAGHDPTAPPSGTPALPKDAQHSAYSIGRRHRIEAVATSVRSPDLHVAQIRVHGPGKFLWWCRVSSRARASSVRQSTASGCSWTPRTPNPDLPPPWRRGPVRSGRGRQSTSGCHWSIAHSISRVRVSIRLPCGARPIRTRYRHARRGPARRNHKVMPRSDPVRQEIHFAVRGEPVPLASGA
jgi:hypothetical protein